MHNLSSAASVEDDDEKGHADGHEDHDEGEEKHDPGDEGHGGDAESHEEHAEASGAHDEHEEALVLSPEEMTEFGVVLATSGPGKLDIQVSLPGEVRLNEDRLAHVVPRLSGIVREVKAALGDSVRKGQVLAILDSRELARAKAAYLAAREYEALALITHAREKDLWEEKISAEKDYLEAKQALAAASIAVKAAEQELEALGLPIESIKTLSYQRGNSFTRYEVLAPFDGTIIDKHVALGEFVEIDGAVFTVADLGTVWIDLSVYQKDLLAVRQGQQVIISSSAALPDATGDISFIGPIVGEETRTALARVVLPNADFLWRPGLFVTAKIAVEQMTVPVRIPKTALQTIEGQTKVFIQDEDGFEAVPVKLGRADNSNVEILTGLEPGQVYVAKGGFSLKAELGKEALGDGGHAH